MRYLVCTVRISMKRTRSYFGKILSSSRVLSSSRKNREKIDLLSIFLQDTIGIEYSVFLDYSSRKYRIEISIFLGVCEKSMKYWDEISIFTGRAWKKYELLRWNQFFLEFHSEYINSDVVWVYTGQNACQKIRRNLTSRKNPEQTQKSWVFYRVQGVNHSGGITVYIFT